LVRTDSDNNIDTSFLTTLYAVVSQLKVSRISTQQSQHGRNLQFMLYWSNESSNTHATVATSPVVLHWLCDAPRTGCAWRTTLYIYVARTSNKRVIVAWKLRRY